MNYEKTKQYNLLTEKQKKVFKLLIKGSTAEQISQKTNLSVSAIKNLKTKIFVKFGATSTPTLLLKIYETLG